MARRITPTQFAQLLALREITLRQLARDIDMDAGYLSRVVRGIRTPSVHTVRAMADGLDVTVDEVMAALDQVADANPRT